MSNLMDYLNFIPHLIARCASTQFLLLAMDCCLELENLQCMEVS
jgi:hypothetical protein